MTQITNPCHSTTYYASVHLPIFLLETAVMGLMGWIMSPPTQSQLTGGDDATGNLPGFVFLVAFFSWLYSAVTIALWLVEVYNPPLTRALISALVLIPANGAIAGLLAWENSWGIFFGPCNRGSLLCKSIWKTLVRVEGVAVFMLGAVILLTLVDVVAALRLHSLHKKALTRLVRMTSVRKEYKKGSGL